MEREENVHRLKVDSSGRIVLPAELRARFDISEGDTVVVQEEDNGLRLRTIHQAIADAQAYYAKLIPPGVSLVDELLAERRSEIERD